MAYLKDNIMSETKKSILYIENASDFHSHIDCLLYDIAYIATVHTMAEAHELLVGSVFNLIVLDLVLEDGSGYSIARELKKDYPDTPIITLSPHNTTAVIKEANASFEKGRLDENNFTSTVKSLLF